MRWNRCLPALALLAFFLPARADEGAASARPKEPAPKKDPTVPAAKPAAAAGSSLTVARDPVTGALRPLTAEEARLLLGRRPLVTVVPQVVTLPDGTRMMRLGPEHASLSVARKNPDGTLSSECVHGAAEARDFLEAANGPVPAPASREK
ncbi:MAG TPA: hypothetical protein VF554_15110 [Thermoanaerobaculia bacterium]|jgi:hypothetical protein